MPSAFISDGYTLTGKVPAIPGLYDAFHFQYRPARPAAVYEHRRATAGKTAKQELQADIDHVLKHLVSWDLTDDQGSMIPWNADNLGRLHHTALISMLDHVNGYRVTQEEADQKN